MQRLSSALRYLLVGLLVASWWTIQPTAGALGGCGYGYTSKSIAQAYLECLQYLNISRQPLDRFDESPDASTDGNCLVRCIGLTTRWWDDERGLREPALLRHFRNTAPTAGQLEQARRCVASQEQHATGDRCRAAYQSFRCYSDQLGELVAHPRFLPPRPDELLRAVAECAALLQLPDQRVARYVDRSFLADAPGTRLLRCIALQLGLYSDDKGVLSERLVLLPGAPDSSSPLKAKQCEASIRDLVTDVCHRAAHSIEHCYGREAFGELWPLMVQRYVPEGTVQQYVQAPSDVPPLPDTKPDVPAAVRSKLVYLRQQDGEQGTGGAVPFEMVIADTDYRDIVGLLAQSKVQEAPAERQQSEANADELP
ncbi:general odorant-binding protein 45-like [Anopheles albimanus]|uniref:Uncharacterized protein n=1 Tax=Anopheles albimanus TaxID=7167 RepID=A0A182FJQ4_ANOAL|nr:general odorant-binding protein 45-like [Anopheles albimanus]